MPSKTLLSRSRTWPILLVLVTLLAGWMAPIAAGDGPVVPQDPPQSTLGDAGGDPDLAGSGGETDGDPDEDELITEMALELLQLLDWLGL